LAAKKPVRLNLRRAAPLPPDGENVRPKSHFWRWVFLVALFHVLAIGVFSWLYRASPPPPPEPFISLLPPGNVVKGTPGQQEAAKLGATTPAAHQAAPPPTPQAVVPPPPVPAPQPVQPKPVIKPDAPLIAHDTPAIKPPKPTPPTPPKPKVKVDLTQLVDGPATDADKPVKPKLHKKHVEKTVNDTATADDSTSTPDNTGLSKAEIAAKLGQKLEAAGVKDAVNIGASGSDHSVANPFADFYASLRDQVMSKWTSPNLSDETAVNPIVQIHVDADGHVAPESVTLQRSSGNQAYDDSALAAARSIGYTLQPLPDGCPPDISITFKLTR
jgi:TonB family protein